MLLGVDAENAFIGDPSPALRGDKLADAISE